MQRTLLTVTMALGVASLAHAQAVPWTGPGANGHFYRAFATPTPISWSQAASLVAAAGDGGYLATLTSPAENAFVFGLIDAPQFWNQDTAGNNQGPHVGGVQSGGPEPLGGWGWVSGEAWDFTAWHGAQPDNAGGAENRLQFFGGAGDSRLPLWNDIHADATFSRGFVVEYDLDPNAASAPEPSTLALLGVALAPLAARLRRRYHPG